MAELQAISHRLYPRDTITHRQFFLTARSRYGSSSSFRMVKHGVSGGRSFNNSSAQAPCLSSNRYGKRTRECFSRRYSYLQTTCSHTCDCRCLECTALRHV